MAKLLQSAFASEESPDDSEFTEEPEATDSDDLLAPESDLDLESSFASESDDSDSLVAKSGAGADGGPGAPSGDMFASELEADGLDDLLSDAGGAPGGGFKAEAVDPNTSADSVRRKEAGGEPDHYGHTGVAKLLRGMSSPSKDSYASEDDSSR